MRKLTKIILIATGSRVVVGVGLSYPYKWGEVPKWRLQIVDSHGRPVSTAVANHEWLDPIDEGVTFADARQADSMGFVEFPQRLLHNRLIFEFPSDAPSAHIFVCVGDEYGDVFFDKEHPGLPRVMILRKGSCPYG